MAELGSFFSESYRAARDRFRERARAKGFELVALPIGALGPDGGELTIDIALRGSSSQSRALVISSGLHGVEGYFGSAVQNAWLDGFEPARFDDLALVVVHALNPYGFAWRRRVNEDNVDLNRNFVLDGQPYSGVHPAYRELNDLLNPASPPPRVDTLLIEALVPLAKKGFHALKNAVAQGQYEYPRGLFYGGRAPSATQLLLREHLPRVLGSKERVVHVDLHTGRGRFATYALCLDFEVDGERFAPLARAFGPDAVEGFDPKGVLYEVRGGLGRWLEQLFSKTQYDCLLAEFGTYGGLSVLARLRAENRAHHYAPEDAALTERTKRALFESFCPRSVRWRATVVSRALRVLEQARIDLAA